MISTDLLRRMCHARDRLQHELEPSAKVAQLAQEAGLTTSHFIIQFSALFGETPLRCRTRARLDRAREMLLAGDESATQISLALGFSNLGSFSRLFTRNFGVPPREYRRSARPFASPTGCIALMNLARSDRNFGEVARADVGQDGGTAFHGTKPPCASSSPASSSTTKTEPSTSTRGYSAS